MSASLLNSKYVPYITLLQLPLYQRVRDISSRGFSRDLAMLLLNNHTVFVPCQKPSSPPYCLHHFHWLLHTIDIVYLGLVGVVLDQPLSQPADSVDADGLDFTQFDAPRDYKAVD